MQRKKVSDPALAALGEFQGKIERSSNFRQKAFNHNLGRNVRVAKLLGYLALMRQSGATLAGVIDCVSATRQNFSSSQSMTNMGLPAGPTQSAHFLPGQIRIGGTEISELAQDPATRGHIEFLFAEVEHLPTPFNQADSMAEAKGQVRGLCSALAQACTALVGSQSHGLPTPGKIPLDLLRIAYEVWHQQAMQGLQDAIGRKGAKPGIPPLVGDRFTGYTLESVAARGTAGNTLWNRDTSLRVLGYYLEDQQQRSWNWVVGSCRSALQEVESNFKG
jgi:hypothetical protein